MLVLIGCFVQLGLGDSDRGLDNRSDSFLYGVYHGVTYLGFAFAAPYVLPRLKQLVQAARVIRYKVQFGLFYIGYFTASIAAVLCLISPLASQVHGVREIFVYSTGFIVTLAFVMVTLDKKSLSQPQM